MAEVDVTYLLPDLRLELYDITEPYNYQDTYLEQSLTAAVKRLSRKWRHRYLVTSGSFIKRNPSITTFVQNEPPVIEPSDETIIILQAGIIMKSAHVFDAVWDVGSWRDDEVSYSNIQSAKSRDSSIERDLEELDELLEQRLHPGKVNSMPGFHPPRNRRENR